MTPHVEASVSAFILASEIKRLDERLGQARREITRLREDGLRKDRHICRLTETEAHVAAALSLALDNLGEFTNPERAAFWIGRALEEMGIDSSDPEEDLREHYRPQREALAYRAQQDEFEAAERFNAWRNQPMAAE